MTTLTSADLIARLRSGVRAEPACVVVDWRSCFDDGPVLETGFDPEAGVDASSDDAALCGDDLAKYGHDERGPWRDTYVIRPHRRPPGWRVWNHDFTESHDLPENWEVATPTKEIPHV